MSQSRIASFVECLLNNLSGIGISWMTSIVVFPLFDISISTADNFWLTIIFTAVSMVWSYCWRRLFARLQLGAQKQILAEVMS